MYCNLYFPEYKKKKSPIDHEHSDAADMFNRVNFDNLKESIELFTAKKNSSGIKPGVEAKFILFDKAYCKDSERYLLNSET